MTNSRDGNDLPRARQQRVERLLGILNSGQFSSKHEKGIAPVGSVRSILREGTEGWTTAQVTRAIDDAVDTGLASYTGGIGPLLLMTREAEIRQAVPRPIVLTT
jgi:hypothetical protein